jgi:hypothetical protein
MSAAFPAIHRRMASHLDAPDWSTLAALVDDDGAVSHAFYPLFPPDESAPVLIAWLKKG